MSQDTSCSVRTSHASGSRSIQTEILNFPVDHILQVSCDWILCCDWYTLHGVGRQVALWPNPRPFPSVWNRVWPCTQDYFSTTYCTTDYRGVTLLSAVRELDSHSLQPLVPLPLGKSLISPLVAIFFSAHGLGVKSYVSHDLKLYINYDSINLLCRHNSSML